MENILITIIYCLTFFISVKYILTKHKDLFLENNNSDNEEEIKNLCDEITMLKSLYNKTKETIRKVVKKLPFNGEEWIQEYIREDIKENYNMTEEELNN